jgi:hypothetical protein
MFIEIPDRKGYLDDETFQNAMRIWNEEKPLREANLLKPLLQKVSEALTPDMRSALSSRQQEILERQVDANIEKYGNKITPDMILGSYELVVTLIWPEQATRKYESSTLHFP